MLRAEDSSVYSSATAIHAQTGAATFAGYGDANYWYNARLAIMAIGDEWTASSRDNEFVPALSYVDQNKINSAGIDLTAVLQQYQQFQPSMQISDVQNIYRIVDDNQAMIPSVIQGLQNGMWVNFQNAAIIADKIGALLSGSTSSSNVVTAKAFSPDVRPPRDPGKPGGGHAYSCSADTATLFFLGLAFTTIGIMSAGTAYGAAWSGVALWGGIGTTAWALGMLSLDVHSRELSMNWIYNNITHIAFPFAMLLALLSTYLGYTARKKSKAGLQRPYVSRGLQFATILILAIGFIAFGILLAHNHTA